jgi:hypothetical protein
VVRCVGIPYEFANRCEEGAIATARLAKVRRATKKLVGKRRVCAEKKGVLPKEMQVKQKKWNGGLE